ncbi:hypothetical protein DL96DRAFT_1558981 [Flagelloscypha sp. PMI_526]|nr:hypothetical protein DL96DRAFT_1558981 [Flagelloscypha sp. PMI_526]
MYHRGVQFNDQNEMLGDGNQRQAYEEEHDNALALRTSNIVEGQSMMNRPAWPVQWDGHGSHALTVGVNPHATNDPVYNQVAGQGYSLSDYPAEISYAPRMYPIDLPDESLPYLYVETPAVMVTHYTNLHTSSALGHNGWQRGEWDLALRTNIQEGILGSKLRNAAVSQNGRFVRTVFLQINVPRADQPYLLCIDSAKGVKVQDIVWRLKEALETPWGRIRGSDGHIRQKRLVDALAPNTFYWGFKKGESKWGKIVLELQTTERSAVAHAGRISSEASRA